MKDDVAIPYSYPAPLSYAARQPTGQPIHPRPGKDQRAAWLNGDRTQ